MPHLTQHTNLSSSKARRAIGVLGVSRRQSLWGSLTVLQVRLAALLASSLRYIQVPKAWLQLVTPQHSKQRPDESGLIAILVALVITTLLALITLGFARIMDREYRQAVDRDLNAQAFYAAQSGINDARNQIAAAPSTAKSTCPTNQSAPGFTNFRPNLSGDAVIQYSCLLYDSNLFDLQFSDLQPGETRVFRTTPTGLTRLLFSWQDNSGTQGFKDSSDYPRLYDQNDWNSRGGRTGLLEVSIFAADPGDSRQHLRQTQMSYLMYPVAKTPPFDTTMAQTGQTAVISRGQCNSNFTDLSSVFPGANGVYACNVIINQAASNPFATAGAIYVSISAVYNPVNVIVRGANAINPVTLPGAQARIDVTGKANDVLRRLQTRADLTSNLLYPDFSVRTADTLCKRLRVPVMSDDTYGNARVDDAAGASAGDSKACAINQAN